MTISPILSLIMYFTCSVIIRPSSAHVLHKEKDNDFNPISIMELASHDFVSDQANDNQILAEDESLVHLRGVSIIERTSEHASLTATSSNITYHGGLVLTSPISVYLIWYGTWTAFQMKIVTDFIDYLR